MPRRSDILAAALLGFAWLAISGFPASLLFQTHAPPARLEVAELLACLAAGALVLWGAVRLLARSRRSVDSLLRGLPGFGAAVLVGLLLRTAWVLVVAPQPASDGATYLELATSLLSGGPFEVSGAKAYWPPGLAFALLPFIALPIPIPAALWLYALAFFVIAAFGLKLLSEEIGLGERANLPVWMLVLWPTHVACAGLPEKELMVTAVMPWLIWLALVSLRRSVAWAALAGAFLGLVVLVQPSFQLLPVAALIVGLLCGAPIRKVLWPVVLASGVMLLTVSPWTLRNAQLLGVPVLVSTNGGSNLYRANNELATGGYVLKGTVDVDKLGELESDRLGKRLAVEWIRTYPLSFVQLGVGKVLLFSGDDSYGVFAAFRADRSRISGALYMAMKALAALPWLGLWLLLAACIDRLRRKGVVPWRRAALLLTPYAYLLSIHFVFESGAKYHIPVVLPLFVLAALLAAPPTSDRQIPR